MSLLALIISIGVMASAAHINTRDDLGARSAIIRSVNHVSMGFIDLTTILSTTTSPTESTPEVIPPGPSVINITETPAGNPGYVAESTASRLSMIKEALRLWSQTPLTILFGIGIGSFGFTLHDQAPEFSISSIVNNQYIEVLTETGILGLILFLFILGYPVLLLVRKRQWLPVAIIAALSIQWLFFSGYPNVIHIWIVLALVYTYASTATLKPKP